MGNVLVRLENLSKKFGDNYVINNLNIDIYEGEFLTLLGPSGCGKTTILRMISGLEEVTNGKVILDGKDVTNTPASKREVNTIFQNFALFPHMDVWDNIYFGLKMKKVSKKDASKKISDAIKLVKLEGYEHRFPRELSGGQQQRVAIARGIVLNHKVLLLDESLSSLDLKLKREMQVELKKLQQKLGMTFIYVTHDQEEALTMSDRIAIINNGTIEQLDTPENIYRMPKNAFIADFIGESNILDGYIKSVNEKSAVASFNGIEINLGSNNYKLNEKIKVVIRPECFNVRKTPTNKAIKGIVKDYIYDGMISKMVIETEHDIDLKVNIMDASKIKEGDCLYLTVPKEYIIILGDRK